MLLGIDSGAAEGSSNRPGGGRAHEVKPQQSNCPIELAVQGGYLLRLWPGVQPAHLREVFSVLERR